MSIKRLGAIGWIGASAGLAILAVLMFSAPVRADLQVNLRRDKVELTDGTVVECIVLMQTERGVLIAVKDPDKEDGVIQKVIPAAKVKSVTRGKDAGEVKGFKTEEELARKVIQGSGYRKDDGDAPPPAPVDPTGPVAPVTPLLTDPKLKPAEPEKVVANSKLSPKDVANEYLSRFPDIRAAAQIFLGGSDRLPELFDRAQKGDKVVRDQLEEFLRLFLSSVQPPVQSKAPPNKQPAKPGAPKPGAPKGAPKAE